ncbi:TPA: hypothetical protein QDC22_007530 [Burkholderia stabilis]|nr:hypothetical protein [Burkholderia stabilis]HDR9589141.1 hypothetical protein [Burkholderia stabilis]HDR9649537.1 hypothetical protein [Burkholderia stabilis]HDR9653603.1 hypothetical protein [Burkholderia stabilis]HDR9656298.1 hypothetical protein [Burkholderia stabilis]
MNQREILKALAEKVQQQDVQLTVIRSAYILLAQQLDQRGVASIADLQRDLLSMAEFHPDQDWQYGHTALAAALRAGAGLP